MCSRTSSRIPRALQQPSKNPAKSEARNFSTPSGGPHGAVTGLRYSPQSHNGPPARRAPRAPARYGSEGHNGGLLPNLSSPAGSQPVTRPHGAITGRRAWCPARGRLVMAPWAITEAPSGSVGPSGSPGKATSFAVCQYVAGVHWLHSVGCDAVCCSQLL